MSNQRFTKLGYPKGPDGRHVCRYCKGPVKRPRLYWCSDKCVEDYKLKSDPGYIRHLVLNRDHGICAVCGVNSEMLRKSYGRLLARKLGLGYTPHRIDYFAVNSIIVKARIFAGWPNYNRTWWEADHILPVCQGGGECGLENYRTLCYRCHKKATKKLAADRAAERKQKANRQMELIN